MGGGTRSGPRPSKEFGADCGKNESCFASVVLCWSRWVGCDARTGSVSQLLNAEALHIMTDYKVKRVLMPQKREDEEPEVEAVARAEKVVEGTEGRVVEVLPPKKTGPHGADWRPKNAPAGAATLPM